VNRTLLGDDINLDKYSFIERLKNITHEQINKIIEEKGKKGKKIRPIIFYDEEGKIIK